MAAHLTNHPDSPLYPPTVLGPPEPLPLPRFLARFVANPLRAIPQSAYHQPIVSFRSRRASIAWVTEPELVERILLHEAERFPKAPLEKRVLGPALGDGILTAQGQSWRWQRRIAAPLFRYQDLLRLVPDMSQAAELQVARWRQLPPGSVAAIERDMTDATYDVVTRTLFAGAAVREGEIIMQSASAMLHVITWEIAAAMINLPSWVWHPGRSTMRRNAARLRTTVGQIVARHREQGQSDQGLIGRLLGARDPESGQPMSDEQVIDNLLTFLLAGHETTAKALTWTLYLLARAPAWQERVRAEVRAIAGSDPIAATHLDRLPVTTRVLKESMRLYPPAPVLGRVAENGATLAGVELPPGTLIVIPIFVIHRHRSLWPDPDRFDPDRFLPEGEARLLRTQFMPFGFGPRTCIGSSFALIESTVLLAAFIRAAKFGWDGQHMPEPVSRVTLRPKGGMPLMVETV